jgi:hypothetical protein
VIAPADRVSMPTRGSSLAAAICSVMEAESA